MYFLCGRPESYRKHRHCPYPIVLPTAEDKTVLSPDWLLDQQAAASEMPPSWNQGYKVAEGQSSGQHHLLHATKALIGKGTDNHERLSPSLADIPLNKRMTKKGHVLGLHL